MRLARGAFASVALAGLTCGCATTPNVDYRNLSAATRRDRAVEFRLTDSIIVVGAPSSGSASLGPPSDASRSEALSPPVSLSATSIACRPESCDPISFAVAPTDSVRPTLAIEPKSRRLITTSLSATYLPNSLRLRVLTIEAKDHRLEAINTVGAIASGAVALGEKGLSNPDPIEAAKKQRAVSPSLADLKLPVTIALADAKCQGPQEAGCVPAILADPASPPTNARPRALPRNPGWTYSLAFIDNPRADGFLPQAAIGRVHGAVIASICRRAQLRLEHAGVAPVEGEVVVADPDWLEEAPFPTKGALTFHPLCGVDVQPESVTEITTDQLATAFFNQVSAVHAAQKSRK